MDAFRWRSIAGFGRMIDVTDIGTEIELEKNRETEWNVGENRKNK